MKTRKNFMALTIIFPWKLEKKQKQKSIKKYAKNLSLAIR